MNHRACILNPCVSDSFNIGSLYYTAEYESLMMLREPCNLLSHCLLIVHFFQFMVTTTLMFVQTKLNYSSHLVRLEGWACITSGPVSLKNLVLRESCVQHGSAQDYFSNLFKKRI